MIERMVTAWRHFTGHGLPLMRRPGESICIGNDVRISVVSVDRAQVRLLIEAPKGVQVFRQELLDNAN